MNERKTCSVRLPRALWRRLKDVAEREGMKISALVERALVRELAHQATLRLERRSREGKK